MLETRKPKDWRTKVKEAAPVATSVLVISATYLFAGVTREEYGLFLVGVVAGFAFVCLPVIMYVAGQLRTSRLVKLWFLLFPVLVFLIFQFLLVPWIAPWIRAVLSGFSG